MRVLRRSDPAGKPRLHRTLSPAVPAGFCASIAGAATQPARRTASCRASPPTQLAQALRAQRSRRCWRRPDRAALAAIGCHGQTVRHRPEPGYTMQLVNGALLAELTGIDVVVRFSQPRYRRRRRRRAAGAGVPSSGVRRSAASTASSSTSAASPTSPTCLRAGTVTGFDCGPGNVLMDAWIAAPSATVPFDRRRRVGGQRAASFRRCSRAARARVFLRASRPKAAGANMFNLAWLRAAAWRRRKRRRRAGHAAGTDRRQHRRRDRASLRGRRARSIVCGGGARNAALVSRLDATPVAAQRVAVTDALGVDAGLGGSHRVRLARAASTLDALTGQSAGRHRRERTAHTGCNLPRVDLAKKHRA